MVKLFLIIIIIDIIFMLGVVGGGGGGGTLGREIIDHTPVSYIQKVSSPPLSGVIFKEEFKVDGPIYANHWERYGSFIQTLRNRLGDGNYSHGLPVLPPQQNTPTEWFDIILRTDSHSVRFRFRRDNLFLKGYRTENPEGQWFELGRTGDTRLIDGSTFLGFRGDYGDLERAARQGRGDRILSQQSLASEVSTLASSTSYYQDRARAMLTVIQMTSESIRFARISDHIVANPYTSSPPPSWLPALENGWGTISSRLLRADADPTYYFQLEQPNAMEIQSITDAISFLGILIYVCFNRNGFLPLMDVINNKNNNNNNNYTNEQALQYYYCGQGQPLVEVLSVRINNIDREFPGDLYGTIRVTDGLGSQYIYNTERKNSQSIYPGDTPLLTGPTRSISAYGSFFIDVALMDRDDDASPDDEVSRGKISWNAYDTTTTINKYDTISSIDVYGYCGSATVSYIVLSDAVEATVEVTLIYGDGEDPADVYGMIQAGSGDYWSVLFWKNNKQDIQIRPGKLIPLLRSVLAVNRRSSLKVYANLWDRDLDLSPNDEIAYGTVDFPARVSGTCEKYITGASGKIRVKVTWASP